MPHRSPPRYHSGPKRGQFKPRGARKRRRNPRGVVFSGRDYRPRIHLRAKRRVKRWLWGVGKRRAKSRRASRIQRARVAALRDSRRAYYNNPPKRRRRRRRKSAHLPAPRLLSAPRRRRRRSRRAKAHSNPPRRHRRRRRSRARRHRNFYWNAPKRRRRRRSRRHHNPSGHRRRRHGRRHRNPGGFKLPGIPRLPSVSQLMDDAFEGVAVVAGIAGAFVLPQTFAQYFPAYGWLNQGWYGVGLSAVSTAVLGAVGKVASSRVAKLLVIGGTAATVLRAAAQLIPSITQQYVNGPLNQSTSGFSFAVPAVAPGKAGLRDFLSPQQIIDSERTGLRDWVQSGQSYSPIRTGISDWVDMNKAGSVFTGGIDNQALAGREAF